MDKLIAETFEERLPSTGSGVKNWLDKIVQAHTAIQKCEAGAEQDHVARGKAFFEFLVLFGFYPKRLNGKDIKAYSLVVDSVDLSLGFRFVFEDGRKSVMNPLMGPHSVGMSGNEPTVEQILQIIIEAFPKCALSIAADEYGILRHVSFREEYLPDHGQISPSGSAVCSDLSIALIQAAVRLANAVLLERAAGTFTPFEEKPKERRLMVDDWSREHGVPKKASAIDFSDYDAAMEQIRRFRQEQGGGAATGRFVSPTPETKKK